MIKDKTIQEAILPYRRILSFLTRNELIEIINRVAPQCMHERNVREYEILKNNLDMKKFNDKEM